MLHSLRLRARRLTSSYLFGRIPLTHVLIFAIQLLGIGHVSLDFENHFSAKPVLTTMVTNSLLNGIADTVAQTVSAARLRGARAPPPSNSKKDGGVTIEIHELGEKGLPRHRNDGLQASSPYDVERLIRYMAWGFFMAPLQLAWFAWLSEAFPMGEDNKTGAALWRVLLDQVVFSPIGLALFFAFMTVTEGGGYVAVKRKLESVFGSTLKSNYVVWPAVQILNFRVIPLQYQLPFASTIGICWTTYLSLKNEAAEATFPG
ncbi:hypothetical protein FN846DRAFT_906161 [Sphaerosporella brunnea]|uniref:Uncharacterized protein n=1 Tax=Sphaerosporella brunnea TaxID=1250544 RepID=A0A5J5EZ19_9PEZI|nr:hypothetical protein FN846DRAFT_906161 [Sphaerosporella brunnea]